MTGAGAMLLDTVIVGAGIGGLAMGMRLLERGQTSFAVIERATDVGGTWRDNTYPGVACDIPSHLYSFSFRPPADWSRVYASGAEILDYLRSCARVTGLSQHIRFREEARNLRWDDRAALWDIETSTGALQAKTVILATGRLSEAAVPSIPGLERFTGSWVHSSKWDPSVDVAGQTVAVIGSGASAIQIVPALRKLGAEVVQFQRSAPYVLPKNDRAYTTDERAAFRTDPQLAIALREQLFWQAEEGFAERVAIPAFIDRLRKRTFDHLVSSVSDSDLRSALTPDYEVGCKRVLYSDEYYPTVTGPGVRLEPSALQSISGDELHADSGSRYRADVIVFATGFDAARPPIAELVTGRGGERLAEHWRNGMSAFDTVAVHGFPNMFLIDLPNAALGHNSAVFMIETQVQNVLGGLEALRESGSSIMEVRADAEAEFTRLLDERSADTVWMRGGCRSWYVDPQSGRLTLLWPDFAYRYRDEVGTFDSQAFTFEG